AWAEHGGVARTGASHAYDRNYGGGLPSGWSARITSDDRRAASL
ncbi:uncharacterized protein METZ01_LOCUS320646, partial [marine metagenome]